MRGFAIFAGGIAASLLAGAAMAEPAKPSRNVAPDAFTVRGETPSANAFGPQAGNKTLRWDAARGRWGLSLDVAQPVDRETQLRDMQAGAFYRVTPSLRIGGAVSLDPLAPTDARRATPQEQAPKVRLETAFKF